MKIADPLTHRVLAYVAAVQRQGQKLTVDDVSNFSERANRSRVPIPMGAAVGGPHGIENQPVVWLYRVGWVDLLGPSINIVGEDEVVMTDLGRAALRSLDEEAASLGFASTVTLDKDDPTALAKVIEKMHGMGKCALVDRYFSQEVFLSIVQRTEVTRILTGPNPPKRIAGIKQALVDVNVERDFEIRVDSGDQHHDRFIIPEDGQVLAIGASMNGVGSRHSIMTEISGPPADAIRAHFEEAWKDAEAIVPPERPAAEAAPKKVVLDEAPPVQVTQVEDEAMPVAEVFRIDDERA